MMEIETETQLDQAIVQGHCFIVFYTNKCRGCNLFLPQWESQMEKLKFVNPKWLFYQMEESKAAALLNHLKLDLIPSLVMFDCPNRPMTLSLGARPAIVSCGPEKRLRRYAYVLNTNVGLVVDQVRPILVEGCSCSPPLPVGKLILKSKKDQNNISGGVVTPQQDQTASASSSSSSSSSAPFSSSPFQNSAATNTANSKPNKRAARSDPRLKNLLRVKPFVGPQMFDLLNEMVCFAADPVNFIKKRNQ